MCQSCLLINVLDLYSCTCKILVKAQNCNYSEINIVPKKSHLKVSGGC